MSNVVLTGFMGTGKSTVGKALARELGYEFIDTDAMIVERYGTIAQIFEQGGEDAFRQHERTTAVELAGRSGCVISTGGRFMLDEHNAAVLVPTPTCLLSWRSRRRSRGGCSRTASRRGPCWRTPATRCSASRSW